MRLSNIAKGVWELSLNGYNTALFTDDQVIECASVFAMQAAEIINERAKEERKEDDHHGTDL